MKVARQIKQTLVEKFLLQIQNQHCHHQRGGGALGGVEAGTAGSQS